MKILAAVLAAVLIVVGWYLGNLAGMAWTCRQDRFTCNMGLLGANFQLETDEFKSKNIEEARRHLLLSLQLQQKSQAWLKDRSDLQKLFLYNIGVINARLSLLEARAGNQSAADNYMTLAANNFHNLGWKDVSPEHIRWVVDRPPLPAKH